MKDYRMPAAMDPERVSLVTFDVGHTLIWPDYADLARIMTGAFNRPVSATQVVRAERAIRQGPLPALLSSDKHHPTAKIPMTAYGLFQVLVENCLGCPVADLGQEFDGFARYMHGHHLRDGWSTCIGPDVVPALDLLKTRYRLAVVSNAYGQVARDLMLVGLDEYFEVIADSWAVGCAKPDQGIFRYVLDKCSVKPEWAVHVGDHPVADIHGALQAGMFALHYDPQGVYDGTSMDAVPTFRNLLDLAEALLRL